MPTPRKINKPRRRSPRIKEHNLVPIGEIERRTPIKPNPAKRGNKEGSNGGGGKRNAKIFNEENLARVESLAASGLSVSQIGAYFGVSHAGIYSLKKRMPELQMSIDKGRAIGIGAVAQKLRTEAEAGNMQAAIFYLKAKAGWTEKVQVDVNATVAIDVATIERIESLTPLQRSTRLKELSDLRELESEVIDVDIEVIC